MCAEKNIPTIAVLLATYQGVEHLREQLDSILGQEDVVVRVIVSDDGSTDGTLQLSNAIAADDPRVEVLPPKRSGSSAGNFFRLVRDADVRGSDAIAFSDQDDIWEADKLSRHFELLMGGGQHRRPGGVSSNVTPFRGDRTFPVLERRGTQKRADFIFDSGGPGSTYLLSPEAFALVRNELTDPEGSASQAPYHDWLIYALVRAAGFDWHIDGVSTVRYRQHDHNVLGAQSGWQQNFDRLRVIASKTHRKQTSTIAHAALKVATPAERPRIEWLIERIDHPTIRGNVELGLRANQFRRTPRDVMVLGALMIVSVW